MSMVQSRRHANGEDDSYYEDGKKPKLLFLDAREVKTYPIYTPNKSQMLTAVHRIDHRYVHHGLFGRLIRNPWTYIVLILFAFATYRSW